MSEDTPQPYREWLQAINDTLDEEVDESRYHRAEIQKLFESIQRDHISPEERARMIDEYHQEELHHTAVKEEKWAIAKTLLKKGVELTIIAEATGLSLQELTEAEPEPEP